MTAVQTPSARRVSRCWGRSVNAATPIHYRFTFPAPEHHWMQVDATFPDLTGRTLELRMSRASPGRYSLHDFAKNVLRRARVRGRRPGAAGHQARSVRVERQRSRRQREGDLQDLRRRRRWDVSRRRYHACAHQHAGGGDVGPGARRSSGHLDVRAADRHALADRDTTVSGSDRVRGHRAEPSVSDGQPGRARSDLDQTVHRRAANVPRRRAPPGERWRSRRVRERHREDCSPGRRRVRGVPGL